MELQVHWFFQWRIPSFVRKSGEILAVLYSSIIYESGGEGRTGKSWGGRREQTQTRFCVIKTELISCALPSVGRRVCSPGKTLPSIDKIHNWQSSLRKADETKVLLKLGGKIPAGDPGSSSTFLLRRLWCCPSKHHNIPDFGWVFSVSSRPVTHSLLPLKWLALTSGRKMRFHKCESSAPASAFHKSLDISSFKWLQ